jgi:hypothetical protein
LTLNGEKNGSNSYREWNILHKEDRDQGEDRSLGKTHEEIYKNTTG